MLTLVSVMADECSRIYYKAFFQGPGATSQGWVLHKALKRDYGSQVRLTEEQVYATGN